MDNTFAPEKKKGKAGKVILVIVIVIALLALLLGLGAFLAVRAATDDKLPPAPSASDVEVKTVALDAAAEVLEKNTITVDSDKINTRLDQVKESVNGSANGKFEVRDLFCELADSKGTIYGRVYVKEAKIGGVNVKLDKVFPVTVGFDVDFEAPELIVIPEKIMCGSIDFPMARVAKILDGLKLPENMRAENGKIYYDTSTLDAQIDAILAAKISESVSNSGAIDLLGSIFGEEAADSIADKLSGIASDAAANATDVQLTDAQIVDDKLIISGQIM